jgi:tetratricopeptide (TPR) repeat protein
VHKGLSELPEARSRYEEALPIYRAIGDKLGEANCIRALGDVHQGLSELPEARSRYEEALPIYRAIGSKLGEANCIRALGELAAEEKDDTIALSLLEQAILSYRSLGLPADEAGAINSIANLYDDRKERHKAIEAYTRALMIPEGQKGYILRNRANQYLKLKDAENATRDIEAAEKIQPNHPYLFLRRGELAILLGHYAEAISYFTTAIQQYPRMNGAYFGIGLAHLRAGQLEEALTAYKQGLSLTVSPSDLDDALEELDAFQHETTSPAHVQAVRQLIEDWTRSRK